MKPKRQEQLAHKLVVLNMLLLDTLDELEVTAKEMIEFKNNLNSFSEKLLEEIKDTDGVLKTTYFHDLCRKVDTVVRKNLNVEV